MSKKSHPHQGILFVLQRKGKAEQIAADCLYICTVHAFHIPLNFDLVQLQDFLFLQKGHSTHIHKFIYRSVASCGGNVKREQIVLFGKLAMKNKKIWLYQFCVSHLFLNEVED